MGNLAKGSPLIKKLIFFVSYLTRAESNQGQGYGSIALDLTIEYIKTKPFGASDKGTGTWSIDKIHALNLYKN